MRHRVGGLQYLETPVEQETVDFIGLDTSSDVLVFFEDDVGDALFP